MHIRTLFILALVLLIAAFGRNGTQDLFGPHLQAAQAASLSKDAPAQALPSTTVSDADGPAVSVATLLPAPELPGRGPDALGLFGGFDGSTLILQSPCLEGTTDTPMTIMGQAMEGSTIISVTGEVPFPGMPSVVVIGEGAPFTMTSFLTFTSGTPAPDSMIYIINTEELDGQTVFSEMGRVVVAGNILTPTTAMGFAPAPGSTLSIVSIDGEGQPPFLQMGSVVIVEDGKVLTDTDVLDFVPASPADGNVVTFSVSNEGVFSTTVGSQSGMATAFNVVCAPLAATPQKVVVTGATRIYRDVTPMNLPAADGIQTVQQVVTPGSLDELTGTAMLTVWGHLEGNQWIAEVILYQFPFEAK